VVHGCDERQDATGTLNATGTSCVVKNVNEWWKLWRTAWSWI